MENNATVLPTDAAARKEIPIASGVIDYFPAALAEIARVSKAGNDQHNPGQPLHWARGKSMDHADTAMRHFTERGTRDTDGQRHTAKAAWRLLAMLQQECEADGAPLPRGARLPEPKPTPTPEHAFLDIEAAPLILRGPRQQFGTIVGGSSDESKFVGGDGGTFKEVDCGCGLGTFCPGSPVAHAEKLTARINDLRSYRPEPEQRAWNEGWTCPRCGTTELWREETEYTVTHENDVVLCATMGCLGYMVRS